MPAKLHQSAVMSNRIAAESGLIAGEADDRPGCQLAMHPRAVWCEHVGENAIRVWYA